MRGGDGPTQSHRTHRARRTGWMSAGGGPRSRAVVRVMTWAAVTTATAAVPWVARASNAHYHARTGTTHSAVVRLSATAHHPAKHPPPTVANPFVNAALRGYLRHRGGNITAAVYDVRSGRTYLYRPGVREHTASIVKVDILATLLHQTQFHGGLDGQELGIAQGMIEASDNDDATDLWNQEGGAPAVHAFDARAGMTQTTPNVAWGLTTTTPRDQLKLLRLVMLPNRLLDVASRVYEYELMRHIIAFDRWGVSADLGSDAIVALKNGWLPYDGSWQINSIGSIVGSGRRYLIAVMTDGNPTESYGIATTQRISRAVWQSFDQPGAADVAGR
jgi:beta-lactamase class A